MQIEQSEFWFDQKRKQGSASTVHLRTPWMFERL